MFTPIPKKMRLVKLDRAMWKTLIGPALLLERILLQFWGEDPFGVHGGLYPKPRKRLQDRA